MPNSEMDAHRRRAVEFAKNQKMFQDAASAYVNDKGASESSLEAVRRVAKRSGYRPKVRIGQHEADI